MELLEVLVFLYTDCLWPLNGGNSEGDLGQARRFWQAQKGEYLNIFLLT